MKQTLFAAGSLFNTASGSGGVYNVNLPGATPTSGITNLFASYGFFATVCPTAATCQTLYTNSSLNTVNAGIQRFALFQTVAGSSRFFLAFDDGDVLGSEAFGDFNDIIITIDTVPEPAAVSLLGLGLLAAGLFRRYRKT